MCTTCHNDLFHTLTKLTSRLVEPSIAEHWYLLGRAYIQQGKWKHASQVIKQATYLTPSVPPFFTTAGRIYYHLGQYEEALDAFFTAVRLGPKSSLCWYNLGVSVRPEWIIFPPTPPFLPIFH